MDQHSSGLKCVQMWSPNSSSSTSSNDLSTIFSPPASPILESLKDSDESDDEQLRAEAKKAVELETNLVGYQIERLKDGCKTKVSALRHAKIEVTEELRVIRKKYDKVQQEVGFNEGKAELLARENEILKLC